MRRKYASISLLLLAGYIGSYLGLTVTGVYMPSIWGLNGIKSWAWTPAGFADASGRLRAPVVILYLPLYWIDHRYWHNDWTGLRGPFTQPVQPNKVAGANAGWRSQFIEQSRGALRRRPGAAQLVR